MRWRMIGPFRGGRTVAASGVPGNTNVFYMAPNNGGVWKTTDAGRTWAPIFDAQPTGSIGALAVSWSRPDRVWVGSGEGLQRPDLSVGNGMYRSDDGGKSWVRLGLADGQQIAAIAADPKNADRAFVAVLGHPYGANETRGIYRTTDAGKSWEKVLYKDADTGGAAVALDPKDPNVVYATLWSSRQGPWENGQWQGPGTGLWKSTDGGTTWRAIGKGLPAHAEGGGRIGFGIAPSDSKRVYATVDAKGPPGPRNRGWRAPAGPRPLSKWLVVLGPLGGVFVWRRGGVFVTVSSSGGGAQGHGPPPPARVALVSQG
jgi:hypothetical protein